MTREEILALDMADIEKRSLEIAEEVKTADSEGLDALNAELDAIEERKTTIKAEAAEQRAKMAAVIEGEGEVIEENKQEERKTMDNIEIRKSAEYLNAWVENLKGRASEEQRTLLTQNADNGTIAVPTYVEDKVNTAWESNEIVKRAKKTYFKGNLKVPYEVSAEGAVYHEEGERAITEEALVLAFAELIPFTLKKMVKYTTEVMDLRGESFVDYIVDEIEYQMAKTAGDSIVGGIVADSGSDPRIGSYTAAGTSLTTADIVGAQGLLGGEASNPVLITTRATAAALKAAALSANYGYDPFDGLEVIYVDSSTISGALGIVADMSGIQFNFPNGDAPTFVFDEYTEAAADVVRVIGRVMVGHGIVAMGKVVAIIPHA